ncbi:MAG: Rrf2 family transcriptional regulator [Chloroflexi bacterium]|mgnify:FL=1|jgi:Rrf2 family cysteine metabolism transcriptional repressor|nr:Rrf2 family transcriptional regulator [Chloroflexota bacterium]
MKISTKGEYGIRAMLELTARYGQGYVQSTEIAEARNIPANYLYQLLITLRKAGVIRSRRGPQGGHMLARPPVDISLSEVVIALEGPLAPTGCVQPDVVDDCPFGERCAVRHVWQRVTDATRRILDETSFADLAAEEVHLAQSQRARTS